MITNISKQSPAFQIYIPGKGDYINYGPYSKVADFYAVTLPEVIVKSKKTKNKEE